MLLKPHEYIKHRIFLVSDFFVLDPELELAEKRGLFDQFRTKHFLYVCQMYFLSNYVIIITS